MPVLDRDIAISVLHRNNKDVDIQMAHERNNEFVFQSYHKTATQEVSGLVSWVVDNMPADYKAYQISLSDSGAELYPIYTRLCAIGANVPYNR